MRKRSYESEKKIRAQYHSDPSISEPFSEYKKKMKKLAREGYC